MEATALLRSHFPLEPPGICFMFNMPLQHVSYCMKPHMYILPCERDLAQIPHYGDHDHHCKAQTIAKLSGHSNAVDEASMDVDNPGRMQEGGKMNLDQLGDDVWLEQFW